MTVQCCDPYSLPVSGDKPSGEWKAKTSVQRPNPRQLIANVWRKIDIIHPSVVIPLTTPATALKAFPGNPSDAPATPVDVYTGEDPAAGGRIILHAPGRWSLFSTNTIRILILDAYNSAALAFFGGTRLVGGSVSVTTGAPATFTPTHVTPIDIDSGADEEVLAAGTYHHLYFRNLSTGAQRITITGNGVTAVIDTGWTIFADPTGAKAGEILGFNNPDRMPVGPFRAIASADNALLAIVHGS